MKDRILKHWKTTLISLVIIGGLGYRAFTEGFGIEEVIGGLFAVGFLVSKDKLPTVKDLK